MNIPWQQWFWRWNRFFGSLLLIGMGLLMVWSPPGWTVPGPRWLDISAGVLLMVGGVTRLIIHACATATRDRFRSRSVRDVEKRCSFCGKRQESVFHLIEGPGVNICDECVELCREILEEARRDEDKE